MKQLHTLCDERCGKQAYAGDIAAGPVHAGDKAAFNRIKCNRSDDRNTRRCSLCRLHRLVSAACDNYGNRAMDQLGNHPG